MRSRLKRSISVGFRRANGRWRWGRGMYFCFGPADGWPGVGEQPQLEGSSGSISGTHSTPRPLSQGPPRWVLSPHTKGPCAGERGLPGASSFRTPTLSRSLGRSVALQVQEAGRGAADQMEPEVRVQTAAPPPDPGTPLLPVPPPCICPQGPQPHPCPSIPAPSSFHKPSLPRFLSFSPSLFLPRLGFRVVLGAWRQTRIYSWKKHP